jgi:hypothetical protein
LEKELFGEVEELGGDGEEQSLAAMTEKVEKDESEPGAETSESVEIGEDASNGHDDQSETNDVDNASSGEDQKQEDLSS